MQTSRELKEELKKCRANQRDAQRKVYNHFFEEARDVCAPYASGSEALTDIINEGFVNVFRYIHHFSYEQDNLISSFRLWMEKMMICAAVAVCRKHFTVSPFLELEPLKFTGVFRLAAEKSSRLPLIRKNIMLLSPSHRLVLHLSVMRGLNSTELAFCLGVPAETALSLLNAAEHKLAKMMSPQINIREEMHKEKQLLIQPVL